MSEFTRYEPILYYRHTDGISHFKLNGLRKENCSGCTQEILPEFIINSKVNDLKNWFYITIK